MRAIIYSTFIILLSSCASLKQEKIDMSGSFYGTSQGLHKGSYDQYFLKLKRDSTFVYEYKIHMSRPKCEGRWKFVNSNSIELKCNKAENVTDMLSGGYMNQREYIIKILSKKKLLLNNVKLKRKK